MPYHGEGDRILQGTAIERKRYVIGEKRPITTDIRGWISFPDNIIPLHSPAEKMLPFYAKPDP